MLRTLAVRLACSFFFSLVLTAPVLGADTNYTVVRGDTLSAISAREHVSIARIVRLNHLRDADYVREGQVLLLASTPATPTPAPRVATPSTPFDGPRQVAAKQALWVATHSGSSSFFFDNRSFAAAEKALAADVQLTRTAMRFLGVPYVWGGESFDGVDCSGFVQAVFHRNGIELPRTADAQFERGRRIPESRLQPGDLVFFETYAIGASHVGIYLGNGNFVHASYTDGVRVDSLLENYYSSRYMGARREAI